MRKLLHQCEGDEPGLYSDGVSFRQTSAPSPGEGASVIQPFDICDQPLVTIGAGALPLPTKHPAKLKEATTNASAKTVFFMRFPQAYQNL
jgi:hypothetical protein